MDGGHVYGMDGWLGPFPLGQTSKVLCGQKPFSVGLGHVFGAFFVKERGSEMRRKTLFVYGNCHSEQEVEKNKNMKQLIV